MTLIANGNTKYVIRAGFNDDQVEMGISIMAHKLPIEKYVFDNKQVPFWKFCQCTYHWLYKTENESDIWLHGGGWNILYMIYVHYDYIHLLYMYFTVIATVSHCCFAASPWYLYYWGRPLVSLHFSVVLGEISAWLL